MATLDIPSLDDIRQVVREELALLLAELRQADAPLLTVAQAAELLGVSARTVKRRIAAGELPVVHVGRAVRVERAALRPSDPDALARLAREALARVA